MFQGPDLTSPNRFLLMAHQPHLADILGANHHQDHSNKDQTEHPPGYHAFI